MSSLRRAALLLVAIPALAACTVTSGGHAPLSHAGDYPEATPFSEGAEGADAAIQLTQARANAALNDNLVLIVLGANWCHDSRALAGWLETPRFQALADEHYEVLYLAAGVPQTGEGRNLDLAEELGVADITGTPTLMVIRPDGTLLNTPQDARSWRNASTRSEDEIFTWLESWTR